VTSNDFIKRGVEKAPSHYSYGGGTLGVLCVPQGLPTENLANAVVADFAMGRYSMLTEVKPHGTRPMRFYMDLDMKAPDLSSFDEDQFRLFEQMVLAEVRRFFPEDSPLAMFEALVLSSGVREVDLPDGGGRGFKAGVHFVFQNLYVGVAEALDISSALIAAAEQKFPGADGKWRDTIDQAVYGEARGLRWAWQFKSAPCPTCCIESEDGRRKPNMKGCACCHRGQIPDTGESMYSPLYFLGGDGVRRASGKRFQPTVDLLMAASIRAEEVAEPTPGFRVYEGAPARPVLKTARKVSASGVGTPYRAVQDGDAEAKRAAAKGTFVPGDTPAARAVLAAIRRSNPKYKDLEVSSITRFESGRGYKACAKGFGSKFCQNVNRDHGKSSVRFIVSAKGTVQECFSKNQTCDGRLTGKPCCQFKSKLTPLLEGEEYALFGTRATTPNSGGTFANPDTPLASRRPRSEDDSAGVAALAIQRRMTEHPVPGHAAAWSPDERDKKMTATYISQRTGRPIVGRVRA
jgi:hypothetical protein